MDFDELVDRLVSLARKGNMRAIELLLCYRYGRPKLVEELKSETSRSADIDTSSMTTDELAANLLDRLKLSSQGIVVR